MTPLTTSSLPLLTDLIDSPGKLLARVAEPACTVRFGQHRLTAGSNQQAQIDYLRALFAPGNDLWSVGPVDAHELSAVGLRLTDDAFASLVDRLAERAPSFESVRMHVHAPARRYCLGPETTATVAEATSSAEGPVLVVKSPSGLVCAGTDQAYNHLDFARQLREYGYRLGEDRSWVGLHASCAQLPDGSGAIMVGHSAAGKSTVALALAMSPNGGFVANDRVMVRDTDGGHVEAIAMPVPIRLNAGTVYALGLDAATEWKLTRPQPDYQRSDWGSFGGGSKLSVLPSEWHERTGTKLVSRVRTGVVVLPQARPDDGRIRIREASPEQVRKALTEQCMTPADEVFVDDWLQLRHTPEQILGEGAQQTIKQLSALPALSVEFGPGTNLSDLAAALTEATRCRP